MKVLDSNRYWNRLRRLFALLFFDSFYSVVQSSNRVAGAAAQLPRFFILFKRRRRIAAFSCYITERRNSRAICVVVRRLDLSEVICCLIELAEPHPRVSYG